MIFFHRTSLYDQEVLSSRPKALPVILSAVTTVPLPASEDTLCRFVSILAEKGIANTSIKVYLSAVCQLHIAGGLPDPGQQNMAKLSQVLRGIQAS